MPTPQDCCTLDALIASIATTEGDSPTLKTLRAIKCALCQTGLFGPTGASGATGPCCGVVSVETPLDLADPLQVPPGNTVTLEGQGTLVNVRSTGSLYTLVTQPAVISAIMAAIATADSLLNQTVVPTVSGAIYVDLDALKGYQQVYHVDENGSDQNYGLFDAATALALGNPLYGPVVTTNEVIRRIGISRVTVDSSIDIQFDTFADYTHPIHLDTGAFASAVGTVRSINLRGPIEVIGPAAVIAVGITPRGEVEIETNVPLPVGSFIRFGAGSAIPAGTVVYVAAAVVARGPNWFRISPPVVPTVLATSLENNLFEIRRAGAFVVVPPAPPVFVRANPAPGDVIEILRAPKRLINRLYVRSGDSFVNIVNLNTRGSYMIESGNLAFVHSIWGLGVVSDAEANALSLTSMVRAGAFVALNASVQDMRGLIGQPADANEVEMYGYVIHNGATITGTRAIRPGVGGIVRTNSDSLVQGLPGLNAFGANYRLMNFHGGSNWVLFQKSLAPVPTATIYVHDVGTFIRFLAAGAIGATFGVVEGGEDTAGIIDPNPIQVWFHIQASSKNNYLGSTIFDVRPGTVTDVQLGGFNTAAAGQGQYVTFPNLPAIQGTDTPGLVVLADGTNVVGTIRNMTAIRNGVGVYTATVGVSGMSSTINPEIRVFARNEVQGIIAQGAGAVTADYEITGLSTIIVRTFKENVAGVLTPTDLDWTIVVNDKAEGAAMVLASGE